MYKRNCKICNKDFETTSQTQKNCLEHKGLFGSIYSLISGELHRKCIKCLNIKKITEFYKKSKARCNSWCKDCFDNGTYKYQSDRATERKLELVKAQGGKCSICSYSKNLAGLVFHHIDEKTKSFELDARTLGNMSKDLIEAEVKKCILICHNCHMEIHYPYFNNLL